MMSFVYLQYSEGGKDDSAGDFWKEGELPWKDLG